MYTQIKVFFSNCELLFDWTQTTFDGVHFLLSVTIHGSESIIRASILGYPGVIPLATSTPGTIS